ncbi:porin family protein [Aliiglaciecola lipolytica]|uniref:OmpA domain protein transmembrane region-containing protein n=1 Tax=Aliiglaciecola lipolytica E3 TaxID=1127673 RepID=K6WWT2_9ALTE|nr:porin family protein [Aliiglaciecola lipolytica]GAC12889.1 OmpA domain protein transmembrane region-containing protein [Aliiglaciecola lipolytica E3]
MKHKTKILSSLTALALITSFNTSAQSNTGSSLNQDGFYLGGNYGYLRVEGDDDFDDDKDAFEGIVGYRFNQYFALEGSYIDFGEYGSDLANADTNGYTAAIKGSLPLNDAFSLFLKVGQLWSETDYSALGATREIDDESVFVGGGVAFTLTPNFVLNATYSVYDTSLEFDDVDDENFETDFKQASVGFEFRF